MTGVFQLFHCKLASRHSILLLVAWLWAALPAGAQTTFIWNTGDGTWDSNAANWDPAGPPAAGDEAILGLFVVAEDAEVTLGLNTPALNHLDITDGVDLLMNGFDSEAVTVDISGAGSRLVVQDGSVFLNNDGATDVSAAGLLLVEDGGIYDGGELTLSSGGDAQLTGGVLEIRSNSGAGFLHINSGSEILGWGTIFFNDAGVINNDLLVNGGTIRTARPFPDLGLRRELIFDTDINETDPLVDLDGTSETGAVRLAHTTTLTVIGTLSDAFSSAIDLRPGSILNISQPWAIDSGAVIDVDAVQTMPLIPATFARIEGGQFTADSGSTINVHSGTLEMDAAFTAEAGSLVEVMDNSTLQFNAAATILDAEAIDLNHDGTTLIINNSTTVILDTSGRFDWDGNGTDAGHATTEVNGGAVEINVGSFDMGADPHKYDGTLNVNSGTVSVLVNNDGSTPWVMDRNLNLANTTGTAPLITGNPLEIGNSAGTFDADLNVSGAGVSRISVDELYFRSDADVEIAAGAVLDLDGNAFSMVYFDGGEFTGSGMLEGVAPKRVISSTTIGQPGTHTLTFDISGNPVSIEPGQALTLHLAALDTDNAVNVAINIDDAALLDVKLPANTAWSLATGSINYMGDATIDTFLAGSPVEFAPPTNVYVNGSGRITARVDFAGDVTITDVGGQLELAGGTLSDPNRLSGGTINGPGELVVGDTFNSRSLVGFGDINANVVGSSTSYLRAEGGTLNVNGSVSGFLSVGTNDENAVLNLAVTFNTSTPGQGLRMFGGEVTGGLIRNDGGRIEGHGRITSSSINNFGTIEANGGTLVIDTVNPSQLDGAAPNNGQGILRAVFGDLEVASNVTTVFNGVLDVGDGRTFTMSQPGSRFRNAPASEDDDGSGDFGQIELSGGTIVVANFEQASELTATGSTRSTIEAENITFESGSHTEIVAGTGTLRAQGNTLIEPGATFAGNGLLENDDDLPFTLADGANVGVRLVNNGNLMIGSSPGTATVDRFVQNRGTWIVEIGGTMPGTEFDQLVVTRDADLGGTLEVELIDLGAGLFMPSLGDTFEILVADSLRDDFEEMLLPALSAGLFWQVITQPDTLLLAIADHIAGDYNRNGVVDAADYTVWRDSFGSTSELAADGNLDGVIDDEDYAVWTANFGAVASSGSLAVVPEPTAIFLLSIGLAGVARLVSRRRKYTCHPRQ